MMISKKGLLNDINDLCLRIGELRIKVKKLELATTSVKDNILQTQLQCAAKGHNFVFEKKFTKHYFSLETKTKYQFKCTNCDLTITKIKDELTPKERKALKDLGILEENENGESPTTES